MSKTTKLVVGKLLTNLIKNIKFSRYNSKHHNK